MVTIISFIAVLGFLIFIHELGHFLAARHVGVRVETFSIGFPPRIWGKKVGDTEYVISWIPLGGYVRLFGQNMIDEDRNDPTNYASKSILQRFYILLAGPAMNLIFAFLFMPMVYMVGVETPKYMLNTPVIAEVAPDSFSEQIGLHPGDEITALNGMEITSWKMLHSELNKLRDTQPIILDIDRNGYPIRVNGTMEQIKKSPSPGLIPHIDPIVGNFPGKSPAYEAGMRKGDRILSIDGRIIKDWSEISPVIQKTQVSLSTESATPRPIAVEVQRQGEILFFEITPYPDSSNKKYLLGMSVETYKHTYGFMESIQIGTERLWFITKTTFVFLGKFFRGDGSLDDLGGPIRIGMVIGEAVQNSVADLFFLIAVISLQLGIFNLFPIPVLDGGHIFFLLVERLKGGPLSMALRERTQVIGMSLLIFLMLVVTYNDILHLF